MLALLIPLLLPLISFADDVEKPTQDHFNWCIMHPDNGRENLELEQYSKSASSVNKCPNGKFELKTLCERHFRSGRKLKFRKWVYCDKNPYAEGVADSLSVHIACVTGPNSFDERQSHCKSSQKVAKIKSKEENCKFVDENGPDQVVWKKDSDPSCKENLYAGNIVCDLIRIDDGQKIASVQKIVLCKEAEKGDANKCKEKYNLNSMDFKCGLENMAVPKGISTERFEKQKQEALARIKQTMARKPVPAAGGGHQE